MMKDEYTQLILKTGLILGVLYTAINFMSYIFNNNPSVNVLIIIGEIAIIAWALIFYGKQAATIKDIDGIGFTYGQAFWFSILVLLLSGVIVGIGQWFLQNVIDPELYTEAYKKTIESLAGSTPNISDEILERAIANIDLMRKPPMLILSTMLSTAIMGGIIALFTSAVVSRKPRL